MKPLSHYWINTSHDTYSEYLAKVRKVSSDSFDSHSSVEFQSYKEAWNCGFRCLELDVLMTHFLIGPARCTSPLPNQFHLNPRSPSGAVASYLPKRNRDADLESHKYAKYYSCLAPKARHPTGGADEDFGKVKKTLELTQTNLFKCGGSISSVLFHPDEDFLVVCNDQR